MNIFDNYSHEYLTELMGADIANQVASYIQNPGNMPSERCFVNVVPNSAWHNNGHKGVKVAALAFLENNQQIVRYQLKWDSIAARPGGNHLGQESGQLENRWVDDADANGNLIANIPGTDVYYNDGRIFFFHDIVEQKDDIAGEWQFRVMIDDLARNETIAGASSDFIKWDEI